MWIILYITLTIITLNNAIVIRELFFDFLEQIPNVLREPPITLNITHVGLVKLTKIEIKDLPDFEINSFTYNLEKMTMCYNVSHMVVHFYANYETQDHESGYLVVQLNEVTWLGSNHYEYGYGGVLQVVPGIIVPRIRHLRLLMNDKLRALIVGKLKDLFVKSLKYAFNIRVVAGFNRFLKKKTTDVESKYLGLG